MAIARLADRQHGVVSLPQLRTYGLTASAVRSRVAAGRLHPVHRGVYAVGRRRLRLEGVWMVAVRACGDTRCSPTARPPADVSLASGSVRSKPGIDVHRSSTLRAEDVTVHDGIPCTSVARTLLDLAEVTNRRGVERAIEQAEVLRRFDLRAVDGLLARSNGRRGADVLRQVLADMDEPALTVNDLEEAFLAICRSTSLPSPEVNVWLDIDHEPAIKADFLSRTAKLVVETDGFGAHGTRQAFEADRRRDQRLRLAGFELVRFTRRQIVREPERVGATAEALHAMAAR